MGGLYLIYDDYNDFTRVHAQHIGPNGLPSPGWPVGGRLVAGASTVQQGSRAICTDDAGGAYVALETSDGLGYVQRLVPDGIVATLASLVRSSVTSDRAVIVWSAPALPSTFIVERRRTDSADWSVLGEASFLPGDQLEYQDSSVEPGSSYYYRLSYSANGAPITSAEALITVPTIAAFALAGAVPNPARASDLRVRFSLPDAEPARVSLIDLNGRLVIDQLVAGGVMGVRDVALRAQAAVRPGLYWLVLEHGSSRATTKVTVME